MDILTTDGVTEATQVTGATLAIGDLDGVIRVGDTLDIGDLVTDIIITPIIMEEEDLLLTIAEETTPLTEITPTEASPQTEVILPEITIQTETIPPIDKAGIQTSEEALTRMEEHTTIQTQISATEEVHLRDKTIVMTILTEDHQTVTQREAMITAAHPEVTLLARHVQ